MLCAELVCRLALGLGTPPLYIADPQIEYMLKPNQDVRRFGNRILVNQWGMRSRSFEKTKATPDEFRVLVFGDSVINGGSQTDHEQLATTRLQSELTKQLKRPVQVGNVSAGSWGPGNWLAYVRRHGTFDADAVVLVVNSGDYADNPTYARLNSATHPTEAPVLALQEAITRYLPRYLPSIQAAVEEPSGLDAIEPRAAEIEKGLAELRAFLQVCESSGARIVILHHPDIGEVNTGRYLPGLARMKLLADELSIPLTELRPEYSKMGATTLFRDSIHPNANGQSAIAAAVLVAVKRSLATAPP
jgi:lysophospholipase L1-like esterase